MGWRQAGRAFTGIAEIHDDIYQPALALFFFESNSKCSTAYLFASSQSGHTLSRGAGQIGVGIVCQRGGGMLEIPNRTHDVDTLLPSLSGGLLRC